MRSKILLLLSSFLLLLPCCDKANYEDRMPNHAIGVEDRVYEEDFSGAYTIKRPGTNECFDIYGGQVAKNLSIAPKVQIYSNETGNPQANHRYRFIPDTYNNQKGFYISSDLDSAGTIAIKNQSSIVYSVINYNDKQYQLWRLTKIEDYYLISLLSNPHYCLAYTEETNLTILEDTGEYEGFLWDISPVVGTYGINSNVYRISDHMNYQYSNDNLVNRYVAPTDDGRGMISHTIDAGIDGPESVTIEDGKKVFGVPYDSKFTIKLGYTYSNKAYGEWNTNKLLGSYNGHVAKLCNDTDYIKDERGNTHKQIGIGLIILEMSADGRNWVFYRCENFHQNVKEEVFEIDGSYAGRGLYYRISFCFEVYEYWTTEEGFWIFKSTVEHYAYYNIREVSDVFRVVPTGFGEEDYGVANFHNLTESSIETLDDGTKIFESLPDNSLTTTGFEVAINYVSYYGTYKLNEGEEQELINCKSYKEDGRYDITLYDVFGASKSSTIYITKDPLDSYFIDDPYGIAEKKSIVCGRRIFNPKSSYLEELNISLPYQTLSYPLYEIGAEYHINHNDYLVPLIGTITRTYNNEEEVITFDGENFDNYDGVFDKLGYYVAELRTSNEYGDIFQYSARWAIVDYESKPILNQLLLKNYINSTSNLSLIYYGVRVNGEAISYQDEEGNEIEKVAMYEFAFSTYEKAYLFALRLEKRNALRDPNDPNIFHYRKMKDIDQDLTEYELFQEMHKNAKDNIFYTYLSNSKSTVKDESITVDQYLSSNGEIIVLGDGYSSLFKVVVNSQEEKKALSLDTPYINDFTFVENSLDSVSVMMTNGVEILDIEYGKKVGEQLEAYQAKPGKYTVIEENAYGEVSKYDVIYNYSGANSEATLLISDMNDNETTYNYEQNGETFTYVDGFKIKDVINQIDEESIIIIEHNKVRDYHLISDIDDLSFTEDGLYKIEVRDHVGNALIINIKVGE